jgi:hypothetical protein
MFDEWNLDTVASISQAINHPFLRLQATSPLLFVIRASTQTNELADFVGYIKRFWPALSVVLIPDEQRDQESWHRTLKTLGVALLEPPVIQEHFRLLIVS